MKPITNILLVLALICYVFLSFYDISFQGSLTGFEFTAGTISQNFTVTNTLFALLPFLTVFAAIATNCLKGKWWTLATIACIIATLGFLVETGNFHDIALQHAPEVKPDNDLGEGFKIIGLGIGYKTCFALTALSLASAILSMLPFKFNQRIEKAVDDTFEEGRKHVREEWNRIEYRHKARSHKPTTDDQQPTTPADSTEPAEDKEDPTRFMPS